MRRMLISLPIALLILAAVILPFSVNADSHLAAGRGFSTVSQVHSGPSILPAAYAAADNATGLPGSTPAKSSSFFDMFPPYLWGFFGIVLGIIVMLIVLVVTKPSKKGKAGALPDQGKKQPKGKGKGKPGQPGAPGTPPFFGQQPRPGMPGMPDGMPMGMQGPPGSPYDMPMQGMPPGMQQQGQPPSQAGMQPPFQSQPGMPPPFPQQGQGMGQAPQQGMHPPPMQGPQYPPQPHMPQPGQQFPGQPPAQGMPQQQGRGMQQPMPPGQGGQPGMPIGMPPPAPSMPHMMPPPAPGMQQQGPPPMPPPGPQGMYPPPMQPGGQQGMPYPQMGMQQPPYQQMGMVKFSVSNLTITPNNVKVGEPVNVSVMVSNNGAQMGKYSVVLRVGGVVENITDMALTPGASQAASFVVIKDAAGDYYADVDGLGGFFTVIPLTPPSFTVSNFSIAPERVRQGQPVIVTVSVTNTGEITGNHMLILRVKGMAEAQYEVTLAPNKSQDVEFQVVKDTPGFYPVSMENWTGKFVVEMDWTG